MHKKKHVYMCIDVVSRSSHTQQYQSSLGVLHHDLACKNILVSKSKVLKIADFGLARNSEEYVSAMKDKLPVHWMSPEAIYPYRNIH